MSEYLVITDGAIFGGFKTYEEAQAFGQGFDLEFGEWKVQPVYDKADFVEIRNTHQELVEV